MSSKVRSVRRRVSFTVPRDGDDDGERVEETGVHAPMNVVVESDSSASASESDGEEMEEEEEKEDTKMSEKDVAVKGSEKKKKMKSSAAPAATPVSDSKGSAKKKKKSSPAPAASPVSDSKGSVKKKKKISPTPAATPVAESSDSESDSASDSESNSDSDNQAESGSKNKSDSESESESGSESGKSDASGAAEKPASAPPSTQNAVSFADMDLDKRVSWAIAKQSWRKPTPVQSSAVPAALAGRDVLVAAPTGSGKTAAYAIPLANNFCQADVARGHGRAEGPSALVLVPTRELAQQVAGQVRRMLKFVQGARVAVVKGEDGGGFERTADVVVGTPKAVVALRKVFGDGVLDKVTFVVVDEADLVLSFGHGADARSALAAVPASAQAMLVSATLDAEGLPELRKVVLRQPLTVKVTANPDDDETVGGASGASHYYARLSSSLDRYLVTYAMLRLNVISGKVLIFTNGINSAFKLKLFLDQFKVKSAVLNAELPANSRVHCVEQFNAGIFDILIATDEIQRDDAPASKKIGKKRARGGGKDGEEDEMDSEKVPEKELPAASAKRDSEFGVSRGVDFRGVAAVINFDTPPTAVAYTHRAGRTARAGASGTVLSLVVDDGEQSAAVAMGKSSGMHVGPLAFRMDQIEAFRYRVEDSLRSVTDAAIRQARLTEVRREMINSDRLKDYFEDNPLDLDALKHDVALAKHVPEHLAHVPGYLLPPALRETVSANVITRPRSRRRFRSTGGTRGKNSDPLKTFSTKGKPGGGNSRDRYKAKHGAKKGGIQKGRNGKKPKGGKKHFA